MQDDNEDGGSDEDDEDLDKGTTSCNNLESHNASRKFVEHESTEVDCNSCIVQHLARVCSPELHISPQSSPSAGKVYMSDDSDGQMQNATLCQEDLQAVSREPPSMKARCRQL